MREKKNNYRFYFATHNTPVLNAHASPSHENDNNVQFCNNRKILHS